jgi:hypothetical protein
LTTVVKSFVEHRRQYVRTTSPALSHASRKRTTVSPVTDTSFSGTWR